MSFALAIAVVALGGFVIWEHFTPEPMVPLDLFRHRDFSGGSLSLALLVLTQYLQLVLGYSPVKAGLAFVPLAVAAMPRIGAASRALPVEPWKAASPKLNTPPSLASSQ